MAELPEEARDVNGGHSNKHEFSAEHDAGQQLAGESDGHVPMVRIVKADGLVWLLSRMFKLEQMPRLLPCAFSAGRELPMMRHGGPVLASAASCETVAIKDWYAYAMSDVNLPVIGPERIVQLRHEMPNITLREYQKQSVQWMLARELGDGSLNDAFWRVVTVHAGPSADDPPLRVYVCPHMQEIALEPPPLARGGILAEEMGLGSCVGALARRSARVH